MDWEKLILKAWEVRERAYSPYSQFQVGAWIEREDGLGFGGCNVENLSFGLTVCAERVAVAAGVAAAGSSPLTSVVVVADTDVPLSPCGACRQVLAEFGGDPWVCLANRSEHRLFRLSELLPRSSAGILNRGEGL